MMEHKDWENYIIAFLNNDITENEKIELDEWLALSASNRAYFEELKRTWDSLQIIEEERKIDSAYAFAMFKDRTALATDNEVLEDILTPRISIHWRNYIQYAAIIALCILSGYQFLFKEQSSQNFQSISQISAPRGSKSDITLADGTHVILNAGSTIELAANFGDKQRTVKLDGEAHFEVAHNPKCPFVVEARNTEIKVLGTKFNVDAYHTNNEIRVFLMEGAVEMKAPNAEVVHLAPNQLATYNINSQNLSIDEPSALYSTNWMDGQLIFINEEFEQIAYKLERKFDIKINIHNNAIKKRRFTGDFVNNEKLEHILKIILSDKRYHYKISESEIDIY